MSEANRPKQPPHERADRAEEPARADAALPMSGRSASVGEIGRELGDLDFDPDDLLASLRPFEPESDAPRLSVAEAEVSLRADTGEALNIAAPRLPSDVEDAGSVPPVVGALSSAAPLALEVAALEVAAIELDSLELDSLELDNIEAVELEDEGFQEGIVGAQPPGNTDAVLASSEEISESTRNYFKPEEPSTNAMPALPRVAPIASAPPSVPKPPARRINAPRPVTPQPAAPTETRSHAAHRPSPNSGRSPSPASNEGQGAPLSNRQTPSLKPSAPPRRPSLEPKPAATSTQADPHAPDVTTSDDPIALDGLLALPPQREQSIAFERERPAHQHLTERGLTEAYGQIAEILQRESAAGRHTSEQVENALVISELYALMGDAGTGSKSVAALGPVAPSALSMQRRQLALAMDDISGYAQHLKADVRAPSSHEGRRHVMALYADAVRLVLEDDVELKKHLELSLRACPSDARFWIHKSLAILLEQQSGAKPRSLTIPESPKLTEALRDLSALRADATNTTHPAGALRAATHAWRTRDLKALLEAIDALHVLDALAPAASWLYASMTVFVPEHRKRGTALTEALLEGGAVEADLALLERRLHDAQALPNSVESFAHPCVAQLSAIDRLTLALAVDADTETVRVFADAAASRPNTLALVQAVQHVHHLTDATANHDVPSLRRQLGTHLGRTPPNSSPHALRDDGSPPWWSCLEQLESLTPDAALVRLLRWVSTMSRGNGEPMAQALLQLAEELEPVESAKLLAVTALLAELVNAPTLREQSLELAAPIGSPLEAVQRSIMAMNDTLGANAVLQRWRDRLPKSLERSLIDLELCAAEEVPRASILAILQDNLASQPALVALTAVLGAASTSGARQIWPAVVRHATSASAQRLTAGLDWFETHSIVTNDSADVDPLDLGFGPASLKIALSQLEELIANSDVNSSMWQKVKTLSGSVPFDITQVDASYWTQDESKPSPLVDHWHYLSIAVHGGESTAFEEQLTAALAYEDASAVDRITDAAALDPKAIATLGSIRAAQNVLEKQARNLAALRTVLRYLAQTGPLRELGKVAAQLAQQLDQSMRLAHAWLAITSTTYASDADSNLEAAIHLDSLIQPSDLPPTWATRRLFSLAQARRDDRAILDNANRLREGSTRVMDAATLTLRAAEAASRLEQWDLSVQLLDRTVELCPEHLVALSMRAEFLEARGDVERAASAYDALATAACMPTHKVAAWVQAASLWTDANRSADTTEDTAASRGDFADKALGALEHAIELDPTHVEANARLKNEYLARGDLEKLELLLTRQLLRVEEKGKRAELELDRAKTLADLGRIDEAQSGLERALSLIPEHVPALLLSAQLHEKRMDFEAAEQQWLQIASHSMDADLQLEAYRRLAVLYETYLEMPARAEVACREVLRRCPNDPIAERLAQLLLRQDNPTGAIELLEQMVSNAKEPNLERTYTLELARIFDEVVNDRRRAEAALDTARRRWPNDVATLRALAGFFARGKDQAAYGSLLDRALADARRALGSGRFDVSFFEVIACVAELRDETETMAAARGTLDALMARDSDLTGLGLDAASDAYSDWLAPEVLSLPLRALLRRSGFALCAAHPIDVRALRVTPLEHTHADLAQRLQEWARGFGLSEVVLYVSPALGAVCQPTASVPATLVVGQAYLKLGDERVQEALALRALRVLSANASALANTAPVELWPLLVGYLSTYLPDWLPSGVDAAKNNAIRDRIQKAMPQSTDRDLPMLAADVAASIGNRGSQLGIAVQQWGSRTALLALGSPSTILSAIAAANGQQDRLGTDPAERQKWLLRNPEARDLAVFSVSDPYLQARAQGLARR